MKRIRLQEFEKDLEEHLRKVRDGESLTVFDSDQPIARIVPTDSEDEFRFRAPKPNAPAVHEIPLPPPLDLDLDVVDVLLEERQRGR